MTDDPRFHLGWFMNFTPDEWQGPFAAGGNPWTGEFYIDMAKMLERACFDYIMIEDTLMVSEAYGGTMEMYLKYALMAPKHDPSPLAAIMAMATQKLGVVATMSTSFYPPFMLARLCATLDHIAEGRFGWNIVTSGEDGSAKNFGMDKLTEHDLRYDIADEYLDVVLKLWDSWEPGAVVLDRDSNTYADFNKVHTIDHEGKYFKVRGPLNTVRSPQGRPAFVQAGGSPKGRQFAAKHADSIIATANGIKGMKAYRDDVRERAVAQGRKPDDVKCLFLIAPVLGETHEEAVAKNERMSTSMEAIVQSLAMISSVTDIDFSQFDLDEPLPMLETNGERGSLDKFAQWGEGKTLRQLAIDGVADSVEFVGTPDEVAEQMGEVAEAVGGDGFLLTTPTQRVSRRYLTEVCDGLIPALQRRGLVRSEYAYDSLRETLLEFYDRPAVRLSVVDLSPVPPGGSAADAYRNSVELAQATERLGYARYWVAEHHALGHAVAGVAPEVLIAAVASATSSIRVGSGAVLLNYATPLRVAETFRSLSAMFGDRIDLGLGRAKGLPLVDAILAKPSDDPFGFGADMPGAEQLRAMTELVAYEEQIAETLAWVHRSFPAGDARAALRLVAGECGPEPWLLGSSPSSAMLAGRLGLRYAFAAFFNPVEAASALRMYRACFTPSPYGPSEPYAVLAVNVCCAETEAEANRLRASVELFYATGGDADRRPLVSADAAVAELGTVPESVAIVDGQWPVHFSGEPDALGSMLTRCVDESGADELMIQDLIADQDARLRSYELIASVLGSSSASVHVQHQPA